LLLPIVQSVSIVVDHSLKNVKRFTIYLKCKVHFFVLLSEVNLLLTLAAVILEKT